MKQKEYEEKIKALELQRQRVEEIQRQNYILLFTACVDSSPEAPEFLSNCPQQSLGPTQRRRSKWWEIAKEKQGF